MDWNHRDHGTKQDILFKQHILRAWVEIAYFVPTTSVEKEFSELWVNNSIISYSSQKYKTHWQLEQAIPQFPFKHNFTTKEDNINENYFFGIRNFDKFI